MRGKLLQDLRLERVCLRVLKYPTKEPAVGAGCLEDVANAVHIDASISTSFAMMEEPETSLKGHSVDPLNRLLWDAGIEAASTQIGMPIGLQVERTSGGGLNSRSKL